ncbi:MAG: fatty acyl-AMP ligase [Labilithrix sp.]|nr:fatty acyl-AMP ligase [Labilithrix sp.]MCW5814086.1 fatty acyl-AMP ligase [Labilithrix sp.]
MTDLAQEIERSRDRDPSRVPPTLAEALRQLRDRTERGFVFVRADGSERFCSFKDLGIEAERRAAQLHARGLTKGDRLAIAVPDPDEFVLSFLGAVMGGIVPVPISPQLSFKNIEGYHDTVAHIANASGASLLLTTTATKQYVDPAAPRAPKLRGVLTVDELAATDAPATVDVQVEPGDLAFLQFTSGSTSRPKGVMVTHRNLAWNSESFMIHGLAKDSSFDKGVTWLPLFHDMGLIGFAIGTLFTDIPVVFLPTASFVRNPRIWLDKIHQHRGTITYAPNFAYQLVTKRIKDKDITELDLSCLHRAGCGAEPIQARTLREFAAKLAPAKFDARAFLPSYGMAEATLAITFVPHFTGVRTDTIEKASLEKGEAKPAAEGEDQSQGQELVSCGHPFPEHHVAVVDENGAKLGDRQVGQIITRGPSVSAGYYNEPELTAEAFKPGPDGATWLYTGDLGYTVTRADGRPEVFICGRLKDMIIVRGRNFYPNDLEWVVSELPSVRRGNVVAFSVDVDGPEGRAEQLVVAAEAFQSDAAALEKAIAEAILSNFSLTTHEVAIVPQGTLPRTSSGKPQRRKTKQMYLDGTLPRARAVQDNTGKPEDAGASA